MKNKWFIIIILGIILSCRNSNNQSSTIQNENHIVSESRLDSIKMGNDVYLVFDDTADFSSFLSNECRKRNPLDNNIKPNSLGEIQEKDTLLLSAEFCQCGEFGGNKEYILVYRIGKTLECQIIKDSVVCRYEQEGKKYYRIKKTKYQINKKSAEAIVDYLELLLRYSLRKKELNPEVFSKFTATIINSNDNNETFKIVLHDREGIWVQFDLLKEIIKTTANTG